MYLICSVDLFRSRASPSLPVIGTGGVVVGAPYFLPAHLVAGVLDKESSASDLLFVHNIRPSVSSCPSTHHDAI